MKQKIKGIIKNKIYLFGNLIIVVFSFIIFTGLNFNCQRNVNRDSIFIDTLKFSDEEVIDMAYNGPKYPDDFFYEDFNNYKSFIYITVLDSTGLNFQIATSDSLNAIQYVYDSFKYTDTDTSDLKILPGNEKYFEYSNKTFGNHILILRVHKKSYFEGLKYSHRDDSRNQIKYIGKINVNKITCDFVKEFFDRYYFFRNYKNAGAKALKRNVYKL
ncbi:MAG: hypothetical protein GXO79_11145, partial [Chlorobi bacterium]|nr:hypothetical protein [Chlorobiota bacterium]